jgi:hypothetical protein
MSENIQIQAVEPRYIMIKENIFDILDLHSLSLYMALRYFSTYGKDNASIKISVKSLCEKSKIKRAKAFMCMNVLESHGLLRRENDKTLGDTTRYLVAQTLGFFQKPVIDSIVEGGVHDIDGGVHDIDGGVHKVDTYHYSSHYSSQSTISDLEKSPVVGKEKLLGQDAIVEAYHEVLPDSPKIQVIDSGFNQQLITMQKNWPKYQKDGETFSIESFKAYLRAVQRSCPGFLLPYRTKDGATRKNNLRTLTRPTNIAKLINGEFTFGRD